MKFLYKAFALITTASILSACASDPNIKTVRVHTNQPNQSAIQPYQPNPQPYEYWHKEGVSQQSVNDKIGHCRIEVGAQNASKEYADKLISYCMKSDNYHLVQGWR